MRHVISHEAAGNSADVRREKPEWIDLHHLLALPQMRKPVMLGRPIRPMAAPEKMARARVIVQ